MTRRSFPHSKRFQPSPAQCRFLRVVETMGRMDVMSPAASAFQITTRRACRMAGWVQQTGTLGNFTWEMTSLGRDALEQVRKGEVSEKNEGSRGWRE